jgi:diguanylate cyclase (GGDEF)-like protein/PAS domain S-box-containing protein
VSDTLIETWPRRNLAAGREALLELQAILENATVGILFSRNRVLVQANPLCAQMFGYRVEELVGQPGRILYPSDDAYEALGEKAGPVLAAGASFQAEIEMRRRDGSNFWCRLSAKAVDPLHPQAGTIWIMEDVTEDRLVFQALEQSTRELSAIFETAYTGIAVVRERKVVRCNGRFEELLGYGRGDLTGKSTRCWYRSGEEYATVGLMAYEDLAQGQIHQREQVFQRKDGSTFVGRLSGAAFDPAQPNEGSVWLLEDVTARRQAEETVRLALAEQEMIFDNAAVGIMFVRNRRLQRCNRKLEEIFGWPAGELAGRSMRVLYPSEADFADHGAEADEAMARDGAYVGEVQLKRKKGGLLWVRATGRRANAAGGDFDIIWIIEDVTERRNAEEALRRAHDELERRVRERTTELTAANSQLQKEIFERMQAEQRIWHVAHHDALTGLPNRTLLHDRLEQALTQAAREGHRVGVMFLDLDRFKSINDSLGHAVGDELLRHVAARLTAVVRSVDTVSRLGGDEFIVVLREIGNADDAVLVAEKIIAALATPVQLLGHELRATPSIGISVYPDDGAEALQLMKAADTAMYHAKAGGRNTFQFFAPRMNEEATRFFHLEQQLRRALEAGELLLHYQPLVDLNARAVCGLEALVRWQHPEQGMRSPAEFIPVAEETGIILPLGEWVLAEALRQNRRWQEQGLPALPVSVNLSPRQFRQKSLVATVRQLLAETGQPARLLELEITESTLMHDVDEALDKLRELAAMGVRLAIDDFGTGYSSLNHLKRFPVHKLKIDQSFVRDLGIDWDDAAIVSAIVSLARALNLETLAEGVETDAQLAMLVNYGCHKFQGYLFSRPLAADQAESLFSPPSLLRPSP